MRLFNQTISMRVYFLLAFLAISITGFSQKREFPSNGKAQAKDFGVTMQINGLINAINLQPTTDLAANNTFSMRYFWREQTAFRLGLGIDGFRNNLSRVDSVGNAQVQFDSTSTAFNFYFNPGFERHFTQYTRFTPFIGAGLNFGFLGRNLQKSTQLTVDTTGTARREYDGQFPGGFLFGLYSTFGFNYFIAPKLALGVEYTFGFYNRRRGGDYSTVIIDTPISGQSTINRTVGSNFTNDIGFSFNNTAFVTLSYFFGKQQ